MKTLKVFSMLFVIIFSLCILSSCQKEEVVVKPGIIYTDTPPEVLFGSNNYAISDKVWVDVISISEVKDKGEGCNYWTDESGNQYSQNCGTWRILQCRKYWGMLNGVHYVSNSKDWYTVDPDSYYKIKELIEKRSILICYIWVSARNPWGQSPSITGILE